MKAQSLTQSISIPNRLRMLRAFFTVVRNVERTDEVFALSERIPENIMETQIEPMTKDPSVASALSERRLMALPNLQQLATLPKGTLGREYAEFMLGRGLDPNFYPTIEAKTRAQYFRLHSYQSHDLWHVVTGFNSDPAGELGLQAFYLAQYNMPLPTMLIAAGLLNAMLFDPTDVAKRLDQIAQGWKMGKQARALFGFDWEKNWTTPVAELRRRLNIDSGVVPIALAGESRTELHA